MAVRTPLFIASVAPDPYHQIYPITPGAGMNAIHQFAGYAFSQYPGPELRTTSGAGTLLPNQGFSDSYYIAGASTSRVDRYATQAETPNVSLVTDTYSRIREVTGYTLPTGDVNNSEYPLYAYSSDGTDAGNQLYCMTRQDFIDTFVSPALPQFGGGGTTKEKGGTYFMTTNSNPANATVVATPAAVNSYANVSAYTAGGIGEVQKQTIDTTYYIAKVNWDPTSFDLYDADLGIYDLPLRFDAGTESIRVYTPAEWAALIGPFLRHYLGGGGSTQYGLSYHVTNTNVGVDGVTAGSIYTDTRLSGTSTYQTRFVNANDYRTQEFPTGTASTIGGTTKYFRIHTGPTSAAVETVSLEGTAATPEGNTSLPISDGSINMGFRFRSTGVVEDYDADRGTGQYSASGHEPWVNITPTGTWYIRATTVAGSTGTASYTSGTWQTLASDRSFYFTDNRGMATYGEASHTVKVEISRNNDGSNIAATGYYRTTYEGGA